MRERRCVSWAAAAARAATLHVRSGGRQRLEGDAEDVGRVYVLLGGKRKQLCGHAVRWRKQVTARCAGRAPRVAFLPREEEKGEGKSEARRRTSLRGTPAAMVGCCSEFHVVSFCVDS